MGSDPIGNELFRMRIESASGAPREGTDASASQAPAKGFGDLLKEAIEEVSNLQKEAAEAAKKLSVGGPEGIHETMIALKKADLSFRMLMQVRNKVMTAYQQIMRMQM